MFENVCRERGRWVGRSVHIVRGAAAPAASTTAARPFQGDAIAGNLSIYRYIYVCLRTCIERGKCASRSVYIVRGTAVAAAITFQGDAVAGNLFIYRLIHVCVCVCVCVKGKNDRYVGLYISLGAPPPPLGPFHGMPWQAKNQSFVVYIYK